MMITQVIFPVIIRLYFSTNRQNRKSVESIMSFPFLQETASQYYGQDKRLQSTLRQQAYGLRYTLIADDGVNPCKLNYRVVDHN
jgi:hypothetical protein